MDFILSLPFLFLVCFALVGLIELLRPRSPP